MRAVLSGRGLPLLLGLAACADARLELSPPPLLPGARAVLFAFAEREALTRGYAWDPAGGNAVRDELPSPQVVWAAQFAERLPCLGLSEGPVALERVESLPAALGVSRLEPDVGTWSAAEPPAELRAKERAPDPCYRLDARILPLQGGRGRRANFIVKLGEQEALVGLDDGQLFRVRPDGARLMTTLSTSTPSRAAYLDGAGTLWLVGAQGQVARTPLAERLLPELVAAEPAWSDAAQAVWLLGEGSGDGVSLWALTELEGLWAWRAGRWRLVVPYETRAADSALSFVRTRDGQILASGLRWDRVVRLSPGEVLEEQVLLAEGRAALPSGVGEHPALGLFAGSTGGNLFHWTGEAWTLLAGSPVEGGPSVITELGPGLLYGGLLGVFAQYHPPGHFCAPVSLLPTEPKGGVQLSPGQFLFTHVNPTRAELGVVHVSAEPPARCD